MKKAVLNILTEDDQPLSEDKIISFENNQSVNQSVVINNPFFTFDEITDSFDNELNDIHNKIIATYEKSKQYTKKR